MMLFPSASLIDPLSCWTGLDPLAPIGFAAPLGGLPLAPVVLAGTDDDDEDLGEDEDLPVAEPADDESDFDDFDDEFDDDFEEEEDDPDWDHPDDGDAEPPPSKGAGKKK